MKPISVQDWKREGYAKKKRSHEGVHTYTGLRIAAVEHGFSRFFFTYRSHHCILVCDSWVHRLFLSLLMSPSWKDVVLIMCESLFHLDPSISPCHIKSRMNFLFIQMVWTSSLLLFKIKSIRLMFLLWILRTICMGPKTTYFSLGFSDDFLLWTFSLGSWKFWCSDVKELLSFRLDWYLWSIVGMVSSSSWFFNTHCQHHFYNPWSLCLCHEMWMHLVACWQQSISNSALGIECSWIVIFWIEQGIEAFIHVHHLW
jgi:hypothetical protein